MSQPNSEHTPRGALVALADRMSGELLVSADDAITFIRDVAEEYPGGEYWPMHGLIRTIGALASADKRENLGITRPSGSSWSDVAEVISTRGITGALRQAIGDPGSFLSRGDDYTESIVSWAARAAQLVVLEIAETVRIEALADKCQSPGIQDGAQP